MVREINKKAFGPQQTASATGARMLDLLQGYFLVVHNQLYGCNSNHVISSIKAIASQFYTSRENSYSPLSTQVYDAPLESYLRILFQP